MYENLSVSMAEEVKEEPAIAAPEAAPEAAAEPDKKKKKGSGEEKTIGKFTHGDHMCHLLFQKGKKFIPMCSEDT